MINWRYENDIYMLINAYVSHIFAIWNFQTMHMSRIQYRKSLSTKLIDAERAWWSFFLNRQIHTANALTRNDLDTNCGIYLRRCI